jgi:hypothetical protein
VRAAAERLVRGRYLRQDDADRLIAQAEASRVLKKELRLGDLVLSQMLYITGLIWLGTAGKVGSSHVMYWIPAVLLFYIPSGIVVVHLNREMPLEGGLYQWAKLRFGDMAGFLVALNLWATVVLILASSVSQIADNLAYAAGPSGAWIAENKSVTLALGALTAFRERYRAPANFHRKATCAPVGRLSHRPPRRRNRPTRIESRSRPA